MTRPNRPARGDTNSTSQLVRLLGALVGAELLVGIFKEIDLVADRDRSGGVLDPSEMGEG